MSTCGRCRFYEPLPDEEAVRLRLQGHVVPEGFGHCGWTPPEKLVLPKAFTLSIFPMHKDNAQECERFLPPERNGLALVAPAASAIQPVNDPTPDEPSPETRLSDVEDLLN